MPLIAVIVVIINVVIHNCFYLAEFRGVPEPVPDVVLHMAKEAFLGGVVPAVPLSGHGLAQALVAKYFNKAVACIMAPPGHCAGLSPGSGTRHGHGI